MRMFRLLYGSETSVEQFSTNGHVKLIRIVTILMGEGYGEGVYAPCLRQLIAFVINP